MAGNRSGDSVARPAGSPPVIQPARASPIAGDEENPEPLQPLATQSPGASGTGPTTKRPSGLIVNSPPRCSATGAELSSGASPATWPAMSRSTPRSSGRSPVRNDGGWDLGSTGSGAASNPPNIRPPRAGRRETAAAPPRG